MGTEWYQLLCRPNTRYQSPPRYLLQYSVSFIPSLLLVHTLTSRHPLITGSKVIINQNHGCCFFGDIRTRDIFIAIPKSAFLRAGESLTHHHQSHQLYMTKGLSMFHNSQLLCFGEVRAKMISSLEKIEYPNQLPQANLNLFSMNDNGIIHIFLGNISYWTVDGICYKEFRKDVTR